MGRAPLSSRNIARVSRFFRVFGRIRFLFLVSDHTKAVLRPFRPAREFPGCDSVCRGTYRNAGERVAFGLEVRTALAHQHAIAWRSTGLSLSACTAAQPRVDGRPFHSCRCKRARVPAMPMEFSYSSFE